MKTKTFSKGFTLIELLIVITIIGILAAALLPSVLGAPSRARDAARKADLNNVIAALEMYNSDNQKYPDADTSGSCIHNLTGDNDLTGYFQGQNVPKDPQNNTVLGCTGGYFYCRLDGTSGSYLVAAYMEQKGDATTDESNLSLTGCDGSAAAPGALQKPDAASTGPWVFVVVK